MAFLLPYKLLYSATKKIINQNLTDEQKEIMLNEATELWSQAFFIKSKI